MRRRRSLPVAALGALLLCGGAVGAAAPPPAGRIAFTGGRGADGYTVYTVRPDGSGRSSAGAASVGAKGELVRPVWSRKGDSLAFAGDHSLVVTDPRGHRRRSVSLGEYISGAPVFSTDGRTVVVPGGDDDELQIVDVSSHTGRPLVRGSAPTFSPDGRRLAWVENGLVIARADGRSAQHVVRRPPYDNYDQWNLSWSRRGRIAFQDDNGDGISIYDVSRRRVVRLPRLPGETMAMPIWSPDGRKLAYVARRRGSRSALLRIAGADGLRAHTVAATVGGLAAPSWSPDGRRIAFLGGTPNQYGWPAAYVLPTAGGRPAKLVRPICRGERVAGVAWGASGRIAFSSVPNANDTQIYASQTDGTRPRRLATSCANEEDPAYSTDGKRIAYARGADVWTMHADGSTKRRVAAGSNPSWSPDGLRLAVDHHRGDRQIDSVPAAGGEATTLTHRGHNYEPDWSRATGRIAFSSDRDGRFEVYTMAADGSDQRRLTTLGGSSPAWAPDGGRIAFSFESNLWTIDADGSDPLRLTNFDGCNTVFSPSWSPDGRTIAFSHDSAAEGHGDILFVPAAGGELTALPYDPYLGARGAEEGQGIAPYAPSWAPGGVVPYASRVRPTSAAAPAAGAAPRSCINTG